MLPLLCFLFWKPKSTLLFLGDSPSPTALLLASAGVRAIWAPPAAPLFPESPAAERRAKLGQSEGALDACVDAAADTALGALLGALLPLAPPGRCSPRSATGGGEAGGQPGNRGAAGESQSLDCA